MNVSSVTLPTMPPEELYALIAELKAWCKAEHSRRKEPLSRTLNYRTSAFQLYRRTEETLVENYLKLRAFLKTSAPGR